MYLSVSATAPSLTEKRDVGTPSREMEISVDPPPMSMLIFVAPRAVHPCEAASPIRRASSMPDKTSTRTPVWRSTSEMNSAELLASRTEAVATAMIVSAPRASAMERNRLMQIVARSIAEGARCPLRSVSWPSLTASFSRARTANESLAAASTTASLIELDPMSIAASFKYRPCRISPEVQLL